MRTLLDLPAHMDLLDCDICLKSTKNGYFTTHAINKYQSPRKGIVSQDGNIIYWDTEDNEGTHMTFKFSSLDNLFEFMLKHKDGNYTNLI